jgi:hypothetical protein
VTSRLSQRSWEFPYYFSASLVKTSTFPHYRLTVQHKLSRVPIFNKFPATPTTDHFLTANSNIPRRAPAVSFHANSQILFCARAVLRQCRVLRESARVAGKIRTTNRETPRHSRKKPNLGRCPQVVMRRRPMLIHIYYVVPLPCCSMALGNRLQSGMVGARQKHGMV